MSSETNPSVCSTDRTDTELPYDAVLVYDGDCPFCSAAATALRRLPETGVIEWDSDTAQQFLSAQFDEPPFSLVFVDGTANQLWLGRTAAEELCDRAGLPTLIRDIVEDNFERIAGTVHELASAKREPSDVDGTRSLSTAASAKYRTLAANARNTHGTGESH